MDTSGGAVLEDGRMPRGSSGHFGERLGELKDIRPSTMGPTGGHYR